MKQYKKWTILTFLSGMIAGVILLTVLLAVAGILPFKKEEDFKQEEMETQLVANESSNFDSPSKEYGEKNTDMQPFENSQSALTQYPLWDEKTVYQGGDFVIYEERIYRAKWWTQNEKPGVADVWEDTKQSPYRAPSVKENETIQKETPVSIERGEKRVVIYYPSWAPEKLDKIQYDVVTHINYAFAIPTEEGSIHPLENEETAKQIIETAHANGVKVLLAVGGWSYQDTTLEPVFMKATETQEKREKLANAILEMCDRYSFDGVDMDWEHPRVDGTSSEQYEKLMLYLATELHNRGKLLTSAVVSGATADGNIYYDAKAHTDAVLNAVDWIHVMAYDGGDGDRHSSYEFAISCASYWEQERGMNGDKIVLGVPFYGRPGWFSYEEILSADENADQKDLALVNGMEVYYNGLETIRKKAEFAKKNLGGIMVWEVTQDTKNREKSLLSEIGKVMEE